MIPAYPREVMQQRICAAVEAGARLRALAGTPGWPSRQTIHRWTVDDPDFARRLEAARAWRRGVLTQARSDAAFDEALAQAFLLRVRRGEAVRALVRAEGMPDRARLDAWKWDRPDFAEALAAAARFSREVRDRPWTRFDEAAGDAIILGVSKGTPLPELLRDPALPGETAVRRWREREPDFDRALRAAHRAGHRARMAGRTALSGDLADEILERLVRGESLREASRAFGMPHYATLMAWQRRDPEFARMVAWGREQGRWVRMEGFGA